MFSEIAVKAAPDRQEQKGSTYSPDLKPFVLALFFVFGGITSLNDVVIPKLKALFTLSYDEAMLVQSAFFAAYFLLSIPASYLVRRVGYMRSAVVGLIAMTAGCVMFVPASSFGLFPLFLLALFVLAAGITTVQVVANPLISMLGDSATASSRLTFAQAFNSLGTTIFPYIGSVLILGSLASVDPASLSGSQLLDYRSAETQVVVNTYLGLGAALFLLAGVVWWRRKSLVETLSPSVSPLRALNLLAMPRFAFGALSIFLYVGAEVSIGSLIVNYLMQTSVLGLAAEQAGKHVPFYWGGAMIGRFLGAYVLRIIAPPKVLAGAAAAAIVCLFLSANSTGAASAWTLLGVGLFNSIMFPTIFSLASQGLGKRAAEGSGVICMAIVGGAIIPLITGKAADLWGLKAAMGVPALCYAGIFLFSLFSRKQVAS